MEKPSIRIENMQRTDQISLPVTMMIERTELDRGTHMIWGEGGEKGVLWFVGICKKKI